VEERSREDREIRKGNKAMQYVRDNLERRYQLVGKRTMAVSTMQKKKSLQLVLRFGSLLGRKLLGGRTTCSRIINPICTRN